MTGKGGVVRFTPVETPYQQIPRALIQHKLLSQDAKWLIIFLSAKPPGWEIRTSSLRAELGWSQERYYKATQQLARSGYWKHERRNTGAGLFEHQYSCALEPVFSPDTGKPVCGEPRLGQPSLGKAPYIDNKIEEEKIENNNCVVAFEDDLLTLGLCTKLELDQLLRILSGVTDQAVKQSLIDELAGAVRARGRAGAGGIRNLPRFLSSILAVPLDQLTYSKQEAALRSARVSARAREALGSSHAAVPQSRPAAGTRPPPEILARFAAIRSQHQQKENQHVQ